MKVNYTPQSFDLGKISRDNKILLTSRFDNKWGMVQHEKKQMTDDIETVN